MSCTEHAQALGFRHPLCDLRAYYLVAFWVESTIYGVYIVLYLATVSVYFRRKAQDQVTSRISMIGNTVLFLLTTYHNVTNVYRMIQAYAMQPHEAGFLGPVARLNNFLTWDSFGFVTVSLTTIWVGDLLVIYRCWIVWNRTHWVLVLPVLLFLASLGIGIIALYFLRTLAIPWTVMSRIIDAAIPICLAQNMITTGLIAYRIWRQHRASVKAGIELKSALTLIMVLRIIIESASVYTLTLLIMIILYTSDNSAIIIVQHASIPITAIVFVLITIRTHVAKYGREVTQFGDTCGWIQANVDMIAGRDDDAPRLAREWNTVRDGPRPKIVGTHARSTSRVDLPRRTSNV